MREAPPRNGPLLWDHMILSRRIPRWPIGWAHDSATSIVNAESCRLPRIAAYAPDDGSLASRDWEDLVLPLWTMA